MGGMFTVILRLVWIPGRSIDGSFCDSQGWKGPGAGHQESIPRIPAESTSRPQQTPKCYDKGAIGRGTRPKPRGFQSNRRALFHGSIRPRSTLCFIDSSKNNDHVPLTSNYSQKPSARAAAPSTDGVANRPSNSVSAKGRPFVGGHGYLGRDRLGGGHG